MFAVPYSHIDRLNTLSSESQMFSFSIAIHHFQISSNGLLPTKHLSFISIPISLLLCILTTILSLSLFIIALEVSADNPALRTAPNSAHTTSFPPDFFHQSMSQPPYQDMTN